MINFSLYLYIYLNNHLGTVFSVNIYISFFSGVWHSSGSNNFDVLHFATDVVVSNNILPSGKYFVCSGVCVCVLNAVNTRGLILFH